MNFFGHCEIVRSLGLGIDSSRAARTAFGSMLPDFAAIVRQRVPRALCPDVGLGVELHHRTDAVFHRSPLFLLFEQRARRSLQRGGVRRGPSRAAAHVGVELILDAHLAQRRGAVAYYQNALGSCGQQHLDDTLELSPSAPEALARLLRVLAERVEHVVPDGPHGLALRLQRILAGRPKLALSAAETLQVELWAAGAWSDIGSQVPGWSQSLSSELAVWLQGRQASG